MSDIPTINNKGRILSQKPTFLKPVDELYSSINQFKFEYDPEIEFDDEEYVDDVLA